MQVGRCTIIALLVRFWDGAVWSAGRPGSFGADSLTHFGGLFLLQRFFQRLGLRSLLAHHVRFDQRNNRYAVSESLLALLYPIILGLGRIETTRLLQHNGVFQYLTGLPTYPDPQTLRRFLVRFGDAGLQRFLALHDGLRVRLLSQPRPPATLILDLDTTVLTVYGRQERAAVGFNPKRRGRPSYLPLLGCEGRTRDCWEASYHPGDTHPSAVLIPFLQRAFEKAPWAGRAIRVRADKMFYDREVVEFIEAQGAGYAIGARMTGPLKERVGSARYHRVAGAIDAAEFAYRPLGWSGPRRFIAIRRPVPVEPSWQLTLWQMGAYTYRVLVTNLGLAPLRLWQFYNDRTEAKLIIRELKEAYALGKIPTGSWRANVAYFHLTVFAYNLLNWCASRLTRTRSVGGSPTEGRARPLVARAAERRGTESPKPADKAVRGTVSESPGRSESEREVASKTRRSGGRACTSWAKAAGKQRIWQKSCSPSGGVISGGMVARARRATGEALLAPGGNPRKLGRPYNRVGRERG